MVKIRWCEDCTHCPLVPIAETLAKKEGNLAIVSRRVAILGCPMGEIPNGHDPVARDKGVRIQSIEDAR